MNSTQTAQGDQKTASGTSPFNQITELEQREKVRVEKEISAMQKEKEDVSQSVAKKENAAAEELKVKAKEELKEYSENDLKQILTKASKEAESDCVSMEQSASAKESDAVKELVNIAKDPDSLFVN